MSTEYDFFVYETAMRNLVDKTLEPVVNAASADRKKLVDSHFVIKDLQERVAVLERFARIKPPN